MNKMTTRFGVLLLATGGLVLGAVLAGDLEPPGPPGPTMVTLQDIYDLILSGTTPAAVPRTGQTGCWDMAGTPIACAGTGQDGEYQMGVSVDPRFTDNGDGTVTDNLTGLIWLKNANCFGYRPWPTALNDANTLSDGACGLTDGSVAGAWRLPNVKEFQSLIDYGRFNPALPSGHPFSGVQFAHYWSSTTIARYPDRAWFVVLDDGSFQHTGIKQGSRYVWPVHGGQ